MITDKQGREVYPMNPQGKIYDKWGRELYPLTPEEQPIYDRLMQEVPQEAGYIEAMLLEPPEQRDWEEIEWAATL